MKDLSAEENDGQERRLMNNFAIKSERVHTINQLLKAYSMFEKDVEYVVIDGQVKIVDEQTGRIMEGRSLLRRAAPGHRSQGRREGEAVTQTFATITLQNYFRMYHKLAGMTGTAETEAANFGTIYKLDVVVIPTNRPIARNDRNDRVQKTKREKYNAVIEEIVLNGGSGTACPGGYHFGGNLRNAEQRTMRHIEHSVLNAKLHQKEAHRSQSRSGWAGNNSHQHGGPRYGHQAEAGSKAAGGLAIIGTERHESRRVDRRLRPAGRQGDPGSSHSSSRWKMT